MNKQHDLPVYKPPAGLPGQARWTSTRGGLAANAAASALVCLATGVCFVFTVGVFLLSFRAMHSFDELGWPRVVALVGAAGAVSLAVPAAAVGVATGVYLSQLC